MTENAPPEDPAVNPVGSAAGEGRVVLDYVLDDAPRTLTIETLGFYKHGAVGEGERIVLEGDRAIFDGAVQPDGGWTATDWWSNPHVGHELPKDRLTVAGFVMYGERAWFLFTMYAVIPSDGNTISVVRQQWKDTDATPTEKTALGPFHL